MLYLLDSEFKSVVSNRSQRRALNFQCFRLFFTDYKTTPTKVVRIIGWVVATRFESVYFWWIPSKKSPSTNLVKDFHISFHKMRKIFHKLHSTHLCRNECLPLNWISNLHLQDKYAINNLYISIIGGMHFHQQLFYKNNSPSYN